MKLIQSIAYMALGSAGASSVWAQVMPPNMPPDMPQMPPGMQMPRGKSRRAPRRKADSESVPLAAGVPVPMDSPPIKAFQQLEQQPVYHMRMTMIADDPRMNEMMAQMGFGPSETTVAGDAKQVIMRMKIPAMDIPRQVDDWEFRSVSRNGRAARLISSPAAARIEKLNDEKLAKTLVEIDKMAAKSVAQSLASGPMGLMSAAVAAGSAALSTAEVIKAHKQAHDLFTWQCLPSHGAAPVDHNTPPPLTDLRVAGDDTLDGVQVTTFEFYVHENGQFHGPLRMLVAKDSGLPARIEMTEPRMHAAMHIDYFDYGKGGDFEVPACLANGK